MSSLLEAWRVFAEAKECAGVLYHPENYDLLVATSHVERVSPSWKLPDNMKRDPAVNPEILELVTERVREGEVVRGIAAGPDGVFRFQNYALAGAIASEFQVFEAKDFSRLLEPLLPVSNERHVQLLYELLPLGESEIRVPWDELGDRLGVSTSTVRGDARVLTRLGLLELATGPRGSRVKVIDVIERTYPELA